MQKLQDPQLKFNSKKHTYTYKDQELESVTHWISSMFPKFDSKVVARKLAKFPQNKANKKGVKYFLNTWKNSQELGTRVHKEIYSFLTNPKTNITSFHDYSLKALEWFDHTDTLLRNHSSPVYHAETPIYDLEYSLAGTIDLLVVHNKFENPKFISIIDWKTNNKIEKENTHEKPVHPLLQDKQASNYFKYSLQLQIYAYILEQNYGFVPMDLILAHLTPEGVVAHRVEYDRVLIHELLKTRKSITINRSASQ